MVQSESLKRGVWKSAKPGTQTQPSIHRLLSLLCCFHHFSVSDYLLFKKKWIMLSIACITEFSVSLKWAFSCVIWWKNSSETWLLMTAPSVMGMGHDIANSYHIVGNFICFQFFPIKIMQQWIPKYLSLCADPWLLLGRNLQKFNCLALTMAIFQILTKKHFRKLVQYAYSTPEYQSGHFVVSSTCLNPVIL